MRSKDTKAREFVLGKEVVEKQKVTSWIFSSLLRIDAWNSERVNR